jgi:hypothetical protein
VKIVLKIKRRGGSFIEVPGGDEKQTYHFAPNDLDDHVADVEDPAHIKVLLGIDVYEVYEGQAAVDEPEAPAPEQAEDSAPTDAELTASLEQMTLEELQAEYHHRFGKAAHPQSKHSTLVKKLAEARMSPDATE